MMSFKKKMLIVFAIGSLLSGNLAKASENFYDYFSYYDPEYDFLSSDEAKQERCSIYGQQYGDLLSLNENKYFNIMRNVFSFTNKESEDLSIEDECYMLKKSDQKNDTKSRFGGLLDGLNLSSKQTNLAKLLQTKNDKQLKSDFKIFIKVYRSEKNDTGESYICEFKIPLCCEKGLDIFFKNEDERKKLTEKIEKFTFFVNDIKNKSPISFSESFICRMVFGDQKLDLSYFVSNNNKRYHEIDYSEYSEDELSDLCKYFIYCIPAFVFDTINV